MRTIGFSVFFCVLFALTACDQSADDAQASGAESHGQSQAQSALPVPTMTVKLVSQALDLSYSGVVQSVNNAEIRPRVGGILTQRLYQEGTEVKQGQVLFKIDDATFRATLNSATADVKQQEVLLHQAQRELNRLQPLIAQKAVSQKLYDDANSLVQTAKTNLEAAKARLQTAQLQLSYTTVRAPITGVAGKVNVDIGSLVDSSALLTEITQLDPIYVNFSLSEEQYLNLKQAQQQGSVNLPSLQDYNVRLHLANGSEYSELGKIVFQDSRVNPNSGVIEWRAEFPNTQHVLLPGQYVNISVSGITRDNVAVIPQKALMQTKQGTLVIVVDENSKAQFKPVKTAEQVDDNIIVTWGLHDGDVVIVDAITKVGMMGGSGIPVKPMPVDEQANVTQPTQKQ